MNDRKRILLVDGDAGLMSIRWLRLMLEGYDVRQLEDGASVRETLESYKPHLLIVDPATCGALGKSSLQEIRSDPRFGAPKIVVNSAGRLDGEPGSIGGPSADAYLDKPAGHQALSETIRRLLREPQLGGST